MDCVAAVLPELGVAPEPARVLLALERGRADVLGLPAMAFTLVAVIP